MRWQLLEVFARGHDLQELLESVTGWQPCRRIGRQVPAPDGSTQKPSASDQVALHIDLLRLAEERVALRHEFRYEAGMTRVTVACRVDDVAA